MPTLLHTSSVSSSRRSFFCAGLGVFSIFPFLRARRSPGVCAGAARPRAAEAVRTERGSFLFHPLRGEVELTATALAAFALANGRRTIDEIGSVLASRYLVKREACQADLRLLFTRLIQRGMVEV